MKAYGLPRLFNIESPDLFDIHHYGLKSSCSRLPGKSGDRKNSFRSADLKKRTRRIWKKKARGKGARDTRQRINELLDDDVISCRYGIFDANTDERLFTIDALNMEAAEQEAACYVAETGFDREFEYNGFYVLPVSK